MIVGRESQWAQRDIEMLILPNNRLELRLVDALLWANDSQSLVLLLVLRNCLLHRCVMLLVARENVRDQGALTGQDATRDLERLAVPKLRLGLHVDWVEGELLLGGDQEAQLC